MMNAGVIPFGRSAAELFNVRRTDLTTSLTVSKDIKANTKSLLSSISYVNIAHRSLMIAVTTVSPAEDQPSWEGRFAATSRTSPATTGGNSVPLRAA